MSLSDLSKKALKILLKQW